MAAMKTLFYYFVVAFGSFAVGSVSIHLGQLKNAKIHVVVMLVSCTLVGQFFFLFFCFLMSITKMGLSPCPQWRQRHFVMWTSDQLGGLPETSVILRNWT